MSENLKCCLQKLVFVTKADPKLQKKLLKNLACNKNDLVKYFKAVQEIVANLFEGNIKLSNLQKRKLSKHLKLIKNIKNKPKNLTHTSRLLVQSGGFLSAVIPPLLMTLAPYLIEKITK